MHHKNPHHIHGHHHDRRFSHGDRDHDERRGGQREGSGHFGGHGDRSHRGDRDLRRFFAHGDPRLVILRLIEEKPRHGCDIIKEIGDRAGGAYTPGPGVIYPTLTLLEEPGYVVVTPDEGARRLHAITQEGRAFLTANRHAVDALFARLGQPGETHDQARPREIVHAVRNLRFAVRQQLGRPMTDAQAAAIIAALDAAAASVEQA